ncbi:MAG: hypothetical protein FJ104_08810 [Deltaproteobacteria bacterium]|nr:hypothetical protein [Deltaproteobacteria bacterium]
MRAPIDAARLRRVMNALGAAARGEGTVYLTGGATAVLVGWRTSTVDVDLKLDPEPPGIFEAIARLKDELDVNIELAAPDQFIPPLPEWKRHSPQIAQVGEVTFRHYDPRAQALAKLERGHARDLVDVEAMLDRGLVDPRELLEQFELIEPGLARYPAIDAPSYRAAVLAFLARRGVRA